jgi:hypothetical protein
MLLFFQKSAGKDLGIGGRHVQQPMQTKKKIRWMDGDEAVSSKDVRSWTLVALACNPSNLGG